MGWYAATLVPAITRCQVLEGGLVTSTEQVVGDLLSGALGGRTGGAISLSTTGGTGTWTESTAGSSGGSPWPDSSVVDCMGESGEEAGVWRVRALPVGICTGPLGLETGCVLRCLGGGD